MFYQDYKTPFLPPLVKGILYGSSPMGKFENFKRKGRFESTVGPRDERDMIETVTPAPRVPDPKPTDQAGGGVDARV